LRLGVWGLGFGVQGLRFRVQNEGCQGLSSFRSIVSRSGIEAVHDLQRVRLRGGNLGLLLELLGRAGVVRLLFLLVLDLSSDTSLRGRERGREGWRERKREKKSKRVRQ